MLVVIIGLNFMPVRFYGETEFWFARDQSHPPGRTPDTFFHPLLGRRTPAKWYPRLPLLERPWSRKHLHRRRRHRPLRRVLGDDGALGLSVHVRARTISRHGW